MRKINQPARSLSCILRRFISGILGLLLLVSLGMLAAPALAQEQNPDEVEIIFFWGNGCPHCAKAEPFLADLETRFPYVKVTAYEVYYDADNQELYARMADEYKVPEGGRGVPFIIIGERYWMGFNEEIAAQIEAFVKEKGIRPTATAPAPEAAPASSTGPAVPGQALALPLIGQISLEHQPLFVSTLLIAFIDGVNPCSIWVLTMLLALTLHSGSRKKVIAIGLIFLTVTASIYALFIAGLFTVLSMVSFIGWIQVVVALMAFTFGAVNIKDYFWYKEGVSFTIDDSKKPGIYKRMRSVMDASQSFWGMAGAT
ncbi:MAG: glutaredoxin family protein, partial [Chloroflexi bacterium]